METEELIKLVDGIYKNILDKFNPGARQMINAGKAYLKALHGTAAASRLYVDAISKLARQAQQGTWGGCADIGAALMKVVEVYKEIQDQQMNILKAFYVDLLVPLETNLEKDTKVVQSEQKRFLQQHKQRSETYSKAAATMKKQRKKSKGASKGGLAMDKELKNMQVLEEEKTKLDSFCEQSLKNAMTQERRRYGFVLERHCSLTKHYMSYHAQGVAAYQQNLDKWSEVAKTREFLPETVENIFSNKIRHVSIWQDDDLYSNPRSPHFDDDRMSLSSQLRKTKSMDASCLDIRSIEEVGSPVTTMSRAKSDFNLNSSIPSLAQDSTPTRCRPKSMAVPSVPPPQWETQLAKALYAYLSSGDNQLSFLEGDVIALIGERNKGWQFGENLRTQCTGWFPLAYTELMDDSTFSPKHRSDISESNHHGTLRSTPSTGTITPLSPSGPQPNNTANLDNPTPRMFGDTIHLHRSSANAKQIRRAIASNNIPPPALPAPIPIPSLPYHKTIMSQSHSTNFSSKPEMDMSTFQTPYAQPGGLKMSTSSFNFTTPSGGSYSTHPQVARVEKPSGINALPIHLQTKGGKIGGPVGNVSLHSSNDSGFSNDPPPQPEVDYSDDDSIPGQTKVPVRRRRPSLHDNNNNRKKLPSSQPPIDDSRNYLSDDQSVTWRTTDEKKGFVKRTKSFWKFGKSGSDNEVLEGMALWKHRDLVDIDEKKGRRSTIDRKGINGVKGSRKSRDRSNDSDKTLNAKQHEENNVKVRHQRNESHKTRRDPNLNQDDFENHFDKLKANGDQFYDHEDGLILRTVNRKNILQQYDNDTGSDTDSETEITSDDPYDCIVVDDQAQKIKRNTEQFPNVAAIGKKLEKLSKSSKYSPDKQKSIPNRSSTMERSDPIHIKNEKNKVENRSNTLEHSDIMKYREETRTFKTFGVEVQNNESGEKDINDERFYKSNSRYYKNSEIDNLDHERRMRSSYESINSDTDQHEVRNISVSKRSNIESENRDKMRYYNDKNRDTSADEFSDAVESKQFLPRTKLTKTNSNASNSNVDVGLMNYGESLKRRLNGAEHATKYNEKSNRSGNTYGPWYDLWGLDSSVRK
ncbi:hypothetical protein RI129_008334 [Pyrocoelia pectoralis]|uniref:Brain-specific angiogenesis inhibitor 1-associated protein 2-like protein 1 n=1 Tax=Pyrocoelia pectoralis TaxID=417401 RepID=A0AAN7ZFY8_9COLE